MIGYSKNIKNLWFRYGKWGIAFALVSGLLWGLQFWKNSLEIVNEKQDVSAASSDNVKEECGYNARPYAVMLASDAVARPLSGIAQADIVVEMPVNPDGVTRMMAVFQCSLPAEIGSIRSARKDFITLAAGFDAVYVHWGGEKRSLQSLQGGIIDNLDALKYETIYFYRKADIPIPHNGFSSKNLLELGARQLNYRTDTNRSFFKRDLDSVPANTPLENNIAINYTGGFNVGWQYNSQSDSYLRFRGGTPEIDALTNEQVSAAAVIILQTSYQPVNIDYIDVRTTGEGRAKIYYSGRSIDGWWRKNQDVLNSPLELYDMQLQPLSIPYGRVWIEVVIS